MSAFFVGLDHINALCTAAKMLGTSFPTPAGGWSNNQNDLAPIARALLDENLKSLAARYPHVPRSEWIDDKDYESFRYEWDGYYATNRKPHDVCALIDVYDYQACEHDGWGSSFAKRFCDWLHRAAARTFPNYGEWGTYEKPADAPQIISLSALAAKTIRL